MDATTDQGIPEAARELIAQARMDRRPKWSQQFLADELCRLGYDATREQIARLERAGPLRVKAELVAAAVFALGIERERLYTAIVGDYLTIEAELSLRLELPSLAPSLSAAH